MPQPEFSPSPLACRALECLDWTGRGEGGTVPSLPSPASHSALLSERPEGCQAHAVHITATWH